MKKGIIYPSSRIQTKVTLQGESLEEEIRKAMAGNEPIKATAKVAYTERKDGVLPQYDIRTDRFKMALEATDKINASLAAARQRADYPEMFNEDGTLKEGMKPLGEA